MSVREIVVLGTSSQVPTRTRNHNGYLLRWDGEGVLFDPGEGTQRQMVQAGLAVSDITRICLSHFHGDHCLGIPGVVQRIALDRVRHPVFAHYPGSGREYFARLRHASAFHDCADIREMPVVDDGVVAVDGFGALSAMRLDHPVEAFGYRLVEPDGRRMVPDRLAAHGIAGPDVGRLVEAGYLDVRGRRVTVDEVSEPRSGQVFAFIMDTRLCQSVFNLADSADLLVIESTFLESEASLASSYGHLTAAQAGMVAARCGVRRLVLTHFSPRYEDPGIFHAEAARHYDGEVIVAADLLRISVPARR